MRVAFLPSRVRACRSRSNIDAPLLSIQTRLCQTVHQFKTASAHGSWLPTEPPCQTHLLSERDEAAVEGGEQAAPHREAAADFWPLSSDRLPAAAQEISQAVL